MRGVAHLQIDSAFRAVRGLREPHVLERVDVLERVRTNLSAQALALLLELGRRLAQSLLDPIAGRVRHLEGVSKLLGNLAGELKREQTEVIDAPHA